MTRRREEGLEKMHVVAALCLGAWDLDNEEFGCRDMGKRGYGQVVSA